MSRHLKHHVARALFRIATHIQERHKFPVAFALRIDGDNLPGDTGNVQATALVLSREDADAIQSILVERKLMILPLIMEDFE